MSDEFDTWLTAQFTTSAAQAPLSTPSARGARYAKRKRFQLPGFVHAPAMRAAGSAVVFASALLIGVSSVAAHTLSPTAIARQLAGSFDDCFSHLGHADLGGCASAFIKDHVTPKP